MTHLEADLLVLFSQNVLRPRRTTRKTNPSTQYDPRYVPPYVRLQRERRDLMFRASPQVHEIQCAGGDRLGRLGRLRFRIDGALSSRPYASSEASQKVDSDSRREAGRSSDARSSAIEEPIDGQNQDQVH